MNEKRLNVLAVECEGFVELRGHSLHTILLHCEMLQRLLHARSHLLNLNCMRNHTQTSMEQGRIQTIQSSMEQGRIQTSMDGTGSHTLSECYMYINGAGSSLFFQLTLQFLDSLALLPTGVRDVCTLQHIQQQIHL